MKLSAVRLLWSWMQPSRASLALATFLAALTIGSSVALTWVSANLICHAALRVPLAELQVAIVGVRFFGLSRATLRYLERLVSHSATFKLLSKMRTGCYRALESLRPGQLRSLARADVFSRVVADVETLEHFYLRAVTPPVVALMVTVSVSLFLASSDGGLGFRTFLILGVGGLVFAPFITWFLGRGAGAVELAARAKLKAVWVDSVQGSADILALGAIARVKDAAHRELTQVLSAQRRMAHAEGAGNAVVVLVGGLVPLMLLPLALDLVRSGSLVAASVAAVMLVPLAALEAVAGLPLATQYLGHSLAAARRLGALGLQAPQPARAELPVKDGWISGSLALESHELRFRYAEDSPWVLEGTSLRLPSGVFAVMTGESGAGKSTLMHLIAEAAHYEGQLRIRGVEASALNPENRRSQVALVTQSTHLFNGTLRDNLRMAQPGASDESLLSALAGAALSAWLEGLPEGLETWLGEEGLRLSGGERQRISIARALLQDAPMLLLDEPTAHLDAAAEAHVLAHLKSLCPQKTILITSHRIAAQSYADLTFRLEIGGRLVAAPVPQMLLAS